MYYVGILESNKKQFDKCLSGKPFEFRLGAQEVIKGVFVPRVMLLTWEAGMLVLKACVRVASGC